MRKIALGGVPDGSEFQHVDGLVRAIKRCLEPEPDILVAYLFGSLARGKSGPLSDVDVAVLLHRDSGLWERRLSLLASLSEAVGPKADLVILNSAPVDLGYRVLRDGILILCNDQAARIEHWVRTVDRYLDMEPFRRTVAQGLANRVHEGKFGRL